MQLIEIQTIKNGSSKVHLLLIGRKWENGEVSLPTPTLNLDKLEESPSLDSQSTVEDPFQKFQPNSLHSRGILAGETASRTEFHSLHPNPDSDQWTVMPITSWEKVLHYQGNGSGTVTQPHLSGCYLLLGVTAR